MPGVKRVFAEDINKWVNINRDASAVLSAIAVQHFAERADLAGNNYQTLPTMPFRTFSVGWIFVCFPHNVG